MPEVGPGRHGAGSGSRPATVASGLASPTTVINSILYYNNPLFGGAATPVVTYSNVAVGFPGAGNLDVDPAFAAGPSGTWTEAAHYDAQTRTTTLTDDGASFVPGELVGSFLGTSLFIVANTPSTVTVRGWAGNADAGDPYEIRNYRLAAGSPCIDAGHNWGVPPDAADLDEDGDVTEATPADLEGNPRFVAVSDEPAGCGTAAVVDMGAYEFPQGTPAAIVPGDIDAAWNSVSARNPGHSGPPGTRFRSPARRFARSGRALDGAHRAHHVAADGEPALQAGRRDHLLHRRVGADQGDAAPVLGPRVEGAYQGAHAVGIDALEVLHVEHEVLGARRVQLVHEGPDLRHAPGRGKRRDRERGHDRGAHVLDGGDRVVGGAGHGVWREAQRGDVRSVPIGLKGRLGRALRRAASGGEPLGIGGGSGSGGGGALVTGPGWLRRRRRAVSIDCSIA